MSAMIGVDVGSTTLSGGLVTAEGDILSTVQAPTHRDGRGSVLTTLLEVVDGLLADARGHDRALLGVGVGLPGLVDGAKGVMRSNENHVPELHGVPLADLLASRTGLPAFVDNDVNALALAEWMFGLGRGATSLVLLAVGTGIGGGIILNSELVRGPSGYAGEFGHVTVNFRGQLCAVCGSRGCLAAYLDGSQIAAQARVLMDPRWGGRDPGVVTAAMVFEAAANGDQLATRIVDEGCEALAASLGGIVNALNPQVLVVTGGVAKSLAPLEARIVGRVAAYALRPALDETRIAVVPSDKRKTVRGGAALVLYELARREDTVAVRADLHDARES